MFSSIKTNSGKKFYDKENIHKVKIKLLAEIAKEHIESIKHENGSDGLGTLSLKNIPYAKIFPQL